MKSKKIYVVVVILTLAFFALLNVNHTTRAAPPDQPICEASGNEEEYSLDEEIPLRSSAFSPSDMEHMHTEWEVVRYDEDVPIEDLSGQQTDATEFNIQAGTLTTGFKYGWRVRYEGYVDAQIEWSDWSKECYFKVGDNVPESLATITAGTSLSDFGMKSIVHWPDNPDPQAVFGITYDPNEYRIGTWNPEKDQYIEFGPGLTIEPGRAYWVLSRNDLKVNFDGVSVNESYPFYVCLHTHPSTDQGWNMIAPPNKANYYWNSIKVASSEYPGEVAIGDASRDADRVINHRIYEWKDGEYISHKLDENFVLEYYKGYWVKAIAEGAYLVFDYDAQVPLEGRFSPKNTMLAWKGKAVQWIKRLLPAPREAIADNDLPPMPLDSFDGGADPLFEGCFVQTVR